MRGPNKEGGARVSRRWWDQKGIDWETAKKRAEETNSESEIEAEEEESRSKSSGVRGSSRAEWSGASVNPWDASTT